MSSPSPTPSPEPSSGEITYDLDLLAQSLAKWENSASLRAAYEDMFADMKASLAPGSTLELGSGIGVLKRYVDHLTTSDVAPTPHADRVLSAYSLSSELELHRNLVAMDVLHHLRRPWRFIEEAAHILPVGGRVILLEPAGTPWGRLFYRLFHVEPCRPDLCGLDMDFGPDSGGEFANMGMAWAMFVRDRPLTERRLLALGLQLRRVKFRDFLAYPLTGGFSKPALLPAPLLRLFLRLEHSLPQGLLKLIGLRVMIVLEKHEQRS